MVNTRKFSQFPAGNLDEAVGLEAGANTRGPAGGGGGGGSVVFIIDQDTTALTVGDWVRYDNTTGMYVPGIATNEENAEIEGVVLNILVNGIAGQFTLQQAGYIESGTAGFNGFVTTGVYFLSDTALGGMTLTEPTTNGYVSKPLFAADGPDSGWVICLMRGAVIGSPAPIPPSGGGTDTSVHDVNQPGNTFAVGNWVYISGDTTYSLADASTLATAQAIGVVIQNGNPVFRVQFSGFNSNTVTGAVNSAGVPIPIVAATVYYLSDTVPGEICPSLPAAGSASKPVFISESSISGTGWVLPQRPLVNEGDNPNIVVVPQVGHGLIRGQVVRISAPNTYVPAQANTFTNSLAVGFVINVIDANTFVLQTSGLCAQFFAPFGSFPLAAAQYYLSDTVAGAITLVEPTTLTSFSKPMLAGLNTTTGYILEQRPLSIGEDQNPTNIIEVTQAGHGFLAGEYVRILANNTYTRAQANNATNAVGVGFVIDVTDANHFILQTSGYCANFVAPVVAPVNAFTPAAEYFLSDTVPGGIQVGAPVSLASYSKPVLVALNATTAYIEEQRPLPNTATLVFLGFLNDGNNYSSTTILQGFNQYIITFQTFALGPGTGGVAGTGGVPAYIGFQPYVAGAFQATNMSHYTSGVNSTAGVNTATLWGSIRNDATDSAMLVMPAISTLPILATFYANISNVAGLTTMQYQSTCIDNSTTPGTPIVYTSTGVAGAQTGLNTATGLRLIFGGGATIIPGSTSYFAVYGVPNS